MTREELERIIRKLQEGYLRAECRNCGICEYPNESGCCYDRAIRDCVETIKSGFREGRGDENRAA